MEFVRLFLQVYTYVNPCMHTLTTKLILCMARLGPDADSVTSRDCHGKSKLSFSLVIKESNRGTYGLVLSKILTITVTLCRSSFIKIV